jgi:histidine ammonia-lyase
VPGTPKLLLENTGINSGFMIVQYTAAALVSENKSLCFPASADSIPTSLGQEDHVSMGSISGRKALQVCGNLENILAVELLCAAQAFDFRRPLKSSVVLEEVHLYVRQHLPHATEYRIFGKDIQTAATIIKSGALLDITANCQEQLNEEWRTLFDEF